MKSTKPQKFAILSHIIPPSPGGQSIVLFRLLKKISGKTYILITNHKPTTKINRLSDISKLDTTYYTFSRPQKLSRLVHVFLGIPITSRLTALFLVEKERIKTLRQILIQEKCKILIVCTGGIFDLPVATHIANKLKLHLIIYSFDDCVYQWPKFLRPLAKLFACYSFKYARRSIVTNEFLQKSYLKRYSRNSTIIRNPYQLFPRSKNTYFNKNQIDIVYSGSIYHAHFDAFHDLINAMKKIDHPVILHIFSSQTKQTLELNGIVSQQIKFHLNRSPQEITTIQKNADVLFLPLAFHTPIKEVIRTSAPGKMGEYLASGRPILVHAPSDSFISWYFKKNHCGIVVDSPDPQKLASAIDKIHAKKYNLKQITRNAVKCAQRDFSLSRARQQFIKLINSI